MNNNNFKNLTLLNSLVFLLFVAIPAKASVFGLNEVGGAVNLGSTDPKTLIIAIINIALSFLSLAALSLIIYGGFVWMTSKGDNQKIDKAKNILKNAAIGLAIILASWGIVTFVISKLSNNGNGSSYSCSDGSSKPCGCGGYMVCSDGAYGFCLGSDCSSPDVILPTSCDVDEVQSGCQAAAQICANNYYCDADTCSCKAQGELGESCDGDTATPSCDADNSRCGEGLSCDAETCACYGPPIIKKITPVGGFCQEDANKPCDSDSDCASSCDNDSPNGSFGNLITISGTNFGKYEEGVSKIFFADELEGIDPSSANQACIGSWTNNQVIIMVPEGVVSGPIKIVTKDGLKDTTDNDNGPVLPDFKVNSLLRPGLCNLSPDKGALAESIAYSGLNLYGGKAYFGNYQNNVNALSSDFSDAEGFFGTSTIPNITRGNSGSFVTHELSGKSLRSNYLGFTKEAEQADTPFISSFSPEKGSSGQYVTISGRGFGSSRGSSHVYFDDVEAVYDFPEVCLNSVWRDDQIIVKVPAGLEDRNYIISIKLADKTLSTSGLNPNSFTFNKNYSLSASLCKIDPRKGPVETPLSLWGEYFGRTGDVALLKFYSNRSATGTIAKDGDANLIETSVPQGAASGPVSVVKDGNSGNSLNFQVAECKSNDDCGNQVCCPSTTYKKGRCVNSIDQCFIDIPSSVYQWKFNTIINSSTPDPISNSCGGAAALLGSCQTGSSCPNAYGICSPYAGGQKVAVGTCDYSCSNIKGCEDNSCFYDTNSNLCLKSGDLGICDLDKTIDYQLNGQSFQAAATCNQEKHWEISVKTSCPSGWARLSGNRCVDLASNCSICDANLSCENINGTGRCASNTICPSGSVCEDNPESKLDNCYKIDQPSCDCCCTIGNDAQDCCAPLKCEGSCGADRGKTSDITLGRCGGCKSAGDTAAERDAACNCTGHSGQFCDIDNPDFPDGVCSDCSSLSAGSCNDHSSACCLDSRRTADDSDDLCRGGNGELVSNDPADDDFGYCAYYNCQELNNVMSCASSNPLKLGVFSNQEACVSGCSSTVPCSQYSDSASCMADGRCCYDSKTTSCRSGEQILEGQDKGFCSYYDCREDNPGQCASNNPKRDGRYSKISICEQGCAGELSGVNDPCVSNDNASCLADACVFPGFSCLLDSGSFGITPPNCGTCCCQPGANDYCSQISPNLSCLADKGSCTGASRGLCCGCSSDSECGSPETIGCAGDTCCQARPEITTTSPQHKDSNVCRNAMIGVDFNQKMDAVSFNDSVILLEERNPDDGPCPLGSIYVLNSKEKSYFSNLIGKTFRVLKTAYSHLFNRQALAKNDVPNENSLYCSIPGVVSGYNSDNGAHLSFTPSRVLDGDSDFYFIVKGDELLDSQAGVLSAASIGLNGKGYLSDTHGYIEGANIKFNGRVYANSHILKFKTMPNEGTNSGICAIDKIKITPDSYLFSTSDNDVNENDADAAAASFDTAMDKDKVFSVKTYSTDDQEIHPVTGYFWDWRFQVADESVATIDNGVSNLPFGSVKLSAKSGVSDGETTLKASIDMSRFLASNNCASSSCSCSDSVCSENCCNSVIAGADYNISSNVYVFICNNPWPPLNTDGSWSPWVDNCEGSNSGCSNYNYKFYYCRDAGNETTADDLPAINNQPVIRGNSGSLVCSVDNSDCSSLNSPCGPDNNNDGSRDGFCVWNVLKESYFFREEVPTGAIISGLNDNKSGGSVTINMKANGSPEYFKIYYLPSGQGATIYSKLLKNDSNKCYQSTYNGNSYSFCTEQIDGLIDNRAYIFQISAISSNGAESSLSPEKTITPTDQIAPNKIVNSVVVARIVPASSTLWIKWDAVPGATSYRLYSGFAPGVYGEYHETNRNSIDFKLSDIRSGHNYFEITALDASGNESQKGVPQMRYSNNYPTGMEVVIGQNAKSYFSYDNKYWYAGFSFTNEECLFAANSINGQVDCESAIDESLKTWQKGRLVRYGNTYYCSNQACPDASSSRNLCSIGNNTIQCYRHD